MNTLKKQIHPFSVKKKTIVFIGIIVTIFLLFVVSSTINFGNNGKSDSIVQASVPETRINEPIETNYTKILIPYAETTNIDGVEKILTIDEHVTYYRFLSRSEEKFSFAVGYMKGCKEGCYFNDETICREECLNPENWREEKRLVMEEKYNLKDFGMGKNYYTGIFIKLEDPGYAEKNIQAACSIDKYPLQLTDCIGYKDSDKTKIDFRFSDFKYRNSTTIVLE